MANDTSVICLVVGDKYLLLKGIFKSNKRYVLLKNY